MKYSSKSLTNVGKVRSANEDNFGEAKTPNGDLFIVCDGMGGHVGGAQASIIAVNSIIQYFQREFYDNVIQAIDHALSFANEQIYASALNNPDLKGMGTTAVVLLIRGEECFIGHVGDSRIYLRSNGKLNRITKDHSFVQTLVDSGVIDDDDAESHPKKNQILQALGIAPYLKATISQSPILPKAGDMFLLCSDGLNGMVNDGDMERIIQEDNLMVTSENLITAALNGGGNDNITASLVLIKESAHSSSRFVHFNPKSKVIDMTSTQQFGTGTTKSFQKKSKLPYFIGGGVLSLLVASFGVMMLMRKEVVSVKQIKLLTQVELEKYVCKNLNDIKINTNVATNEDTIINSQCEGANHVFIIKDSLIIKTYTETIFKPIPKSTSLKKINDMTKTEITALIVGSPVEDEKGEFKRYGFKIEVNNKKVKSKVKIEEKDDKIIKNHTVKSGETLSKIVDLYKANSPGLTVEALKDFNVEDSNSTLTKEQKEDLSKDLIEAGMKLKIPKIP